MFYSYCHKFKSVTQTELMLRWFVLLLSSLKFEDIKTRLLNYSSVYLVYQASRINTD